MPATSTTATFTVRDHGYDVAEVEARITELESRIARLEATGEQDPEQDRRLLKHTRFEALRLLMSARDDAEAMIAEARAEAEAIVAGARQSTGITEDDTIPLDAPLEAIKAELPVGTQAAFVSVARHRAG